MSWLFSFINTTTVLLQPQGLVTYSHLILRHFSILPALVISVAYSVVLLFLVLLFLLYFFLVYFTQYLKSKAANKKYCHGSLLVGSRLFNLCNRFRHEISNFHYPITTYLQRTKICDIYLFRSEYIYSVRQYSDDWDRGCRIQSSLRPLYRILEQRQCLSVTYKAHTKTNNMRRLFTMFQCFSVHTTKITINISVHVNKASLC